MEHASVLQFRLYARRFNNCKWSIKMRRYIILYRNASGVKRIEMIRALDINDATSQAEKFCSKMGRTLYAIDRGSL
jgi:hypothetical protein